MDEMLIRGEMVQKNLSNRREHRVNLFISLLSRVFPRENLLVKSEISVENLKPSTQT